MTGLPADRDQIRRHVEATLGPELDVMERRAFHVQPADPTLRGIPIEYELPHVTGHQAKALQLQLCGHDNNARRWDKAVDIEELREMMFDTVLDHGHAVMMAPPTEGIPAPYAYTAGRTLKKRPELIVTGMTGEPARQLLNEVCAYDDVLGVEPDVTIPVAGVEVRLIRSDPRNLSAAILAFGVINAYQVLLPGADGEYPDSIRGRTSLQPVLPEIPGDAWDPYDEED